MGVPEGRQLCSVKESYLIAYNAFRTLRYVRKAKKDGRMSSQFIRRMMLAVTEVNRCQICSFAHTRMALEDGMSDAEIRNILNGVLDDVPAAEMAAMMFAQHYAESRGRPSVGSWQRVVEVYGTATAEGILGAVRTIMMGNAFGIAFSSFANRFRGRPDPRSGLGYELAMVLGSLVMFPAAMTHAIVSRAMKRPLISF